MSKNCLQKDLTNVDLSNFLLNVDNPKSIYYYTSRLLNTNDRSCSINWAGALNVNITSDARRTLDAVYMTQRRNNKNKAGNISFILDLFPHQNFPKSRLIKIITRKSMPVNMPNPKAGQLKAVTYGYNNQYSQSYPEPEFVMTDKYFIMYTRNMWDRKKELKSADMTDEPEEEVVEEVVEDIEEEEARIYGTVHQP